MEVIFKYSDRFGVKYVSIVVALQICLLEITCLNCSFLDSVKVFLLEKDLDLGLIAPL